jgi:hypothetical protein
MAETRVIEDTLCGRGFARINVRGDTNISGISKIF